MRPLPPILSALAQQLLEENSSGIVELVEGLGSPLQICLPTEFAANIRAYRDTFAERGVSGAVFFAAKVNRAPLFLATAAAEGIGADVASVQEFGAAVSNGIRTPAIVLTGPDKSEAFLALAAIHGATVTIDSIGELERLAGIHRSLGLSEPTRALMRIGGLYMGSTSGGAPARRDESRFGLTIEDWQVAHAAFLAPVVQSAVKFVGFSFHLDSHDLMDRVGAIDTILQLGRSARSAGLKFEIIDIGGGIPSQYISRDHWLEFVREYSDAIDQIGLSPFYRGVDFGMRLEGAALTRGRIYPHDIELHKSQFLGALLDHRLGSGRSIATECREEGVAIWMEPGRSLLDQSGFTVATVCGVKRTRGRNLVMLDMNVSQLWDQVIGSEFMVDPLLLGASAETRDGFVCNVVGNLCLEADVLSWRSVTFPREPRRGDTVVIPNTAGYQMDFIEAPMHGRPVSRKIAMWNDNGTWRWSSAEQFSLVCARRLG